MNVGASRRVFLFLFNILFWVGLFTFILVTRLYKIDTVAFVEASIEIPTRRILGNGILIGVLVAIPYSLMEVLLKNRGIYSRSLLRIIVDRTVIQFIIATVVLLLISSINIYLDKLSGQEEISQRSMSFYIHSTSVHLLLVGALLGNIVLSIFRTLQMKIGEDVFFDLLVGRYRPALEENRAFLFIDLRSSTSIAEQLGHVQYSYLIQDCFSDLHHAVVETGASLYQYVGDEAVLTWMADEAIREQNCLRAFFIFEKYISNRADHYRNKYGLVPEFKSGLNMGKVMTAEVGVIKRDIAYHSDVLNTAARLEGMCNETGSRLLTTENVISALGPDRGFEFDPKGEITLRGKRATVGVFAVIPSSEDPPAS